MIPLHLEGDDANLSGGCGCPTRIITPADIGAETPTGAQDKANIAERSAKSAAAIALASHAGDFNNPHRVSKAQVGLGNVTDDAQVKRSEMGVPNGVATLDSAGRVPAAQISQEVLNAAETAITQAQVAIQKAAEAASSAEGALASEEAAGLSAQSAAADSIATGEDRAQTEQDAAATAADRIATGQDRTQTGEDRTATGQDRATVAADKQTVADDKALTLGYKNTAETAAGTATTKATEAAQSADEAAASAAASAGVLQAETIAALKLLDVSGFTTGRQVNVAGYYAAGDGGGGLFTYDSASAATDNGGTVIAPDAGSGRWLRAWSGSLSVKWFGAKGDGVTDDTEALQAAIETCTGPTGLSFDPVVNRGTTIYVPPGVFVISERLLVTKSLTRIIGDSAHSSTIKYINGAQGATELIRFLQVAYCELSDIALDGGAGFNPVVTANAADSGATLDFCQYFVSRSVAVRYTRKTGLKCILLWESYISNLTCHYLGLAAGANEGGAVWMTNDGAENTHGVGPCNNTKIDKLTAGVDGTVVRIDAANTIAIVFSQIEAESYPFASATAVSNQDKFVVSGAANRRISFSGKCTFHSFDDAHATADVFSINDTSSDISISELSVAVIAEPGRTFRPVRYYMTSTGSNPVWIDRATVRDASGYMVGYFNLSGSATILGGRMYCEEPNTTPVSKYITGTYLELVSFGLNLFTSNGKILNPGVNRRGKIDGVDGYAPTIFDEVILVDTSSGAKNVALTLANLIYRTVTIKKTTGDTNAVTVSPDGTNTIEGVNAALTLADPYASVTLYIDSTPKAWIVDLRKAISVNGTSTNNNALAGDVGEEVAASVASSSPVSLAVSGGTYNVASINLTAGDWEVEAIAGFKPTGASVSVIYAGISTTSGNFNAEGSYIQDQVSYTGLSGNFMRSVKRRLSLAATTAVYLVENATFSAGSVGGFGVLRARRVR
jgi:hypothetical protein